MERQAAVPELQQHNLPMDDIEQLFFNGNMNVDEEEPLENAAAIDEQPHNNDSMNDATCWVFGYGSLCWYPGFEYSKCITGYIKGFERRFWQGNTTHRGTIDKPGRVATLITKKEGITWGCAYKISGETALEYLKMRECTLGGYATLVTKFYPRIASYDSAFTGEAIKALVYIALPDNELWLGEASSHNIATQIATVSGASGHNAEYLLRLSKFMHEEIPDAMDEHLFELERLVLDELRQREIPLWAVMGITPERIRRDSHEEIKRPPNFEFTSRIPKEKLRCLNI